MRNRAVAFVLLSWTFLLQGCVSNVRETPVVRVVRKNAASVVNISTERVVLLQANPFWGIYGDYFDRYFSDPIHRLPATAMRTQSLGSGVIVDGDGLIVTNAHVVQMANKVYVTLLDGKTYEAAVIGTNQQDDVALIRIQGVKNLRPIRLAKDVMIGETIVVIGNPLGLQNSVTTGVVSGTHRGFAAGTANAFSDLIQTDASINPGSSGGGLLNLEGELIGINLAVVEHAQNIGFAVPVGKVKAMLDEYHRVMKERASRPKPSGAAL